MKKIFLLAAVFCMVFSLYAREQPNVIVHKSNGGYLAWLNLYNDIDYTPSPDGIEPARLNCTGSGWSFCRVPHISMGSFQSSFTPNQNWTAVNKACVSAINEIIEFSEARSRAGNNQGSKSITLSVPTQNRGFNTTYVVKGEWRYNQYGEGDLYVFISVFDDSHRY